MRHAFPLLYCLPDDTKAKLLGKVSELDSVPAAMWKECKDSQASPMPSVPPGSAEVDYAKFMRQVPSRSRG